MEALGTEAHAASAAELNEHIAILKRWYYRGRRTGEVFLCDQRGELPLRRIVRGIGRVYRGETDSVSPDSTSAAIEPVN